MRLPNVKMLLCWSSKVHIYIFVENRTFLEQFDSIGVPAHFTYALYTKVRNLIDGTTSGCTR